MIIWKKKLIRCCKCGKAYSFDDNLFYHLKEYILICPNCNLMHKVDIKLLGKEYEGLKKIDKLDLTAIDIGSAAVDGNDYWNGNTWINGANSANASGKITSVEIYAKGTMANCSVGTFYLVSGTNFTTRDYEMVNNGNGAGVVVAGSKQTFTVDLDVEEGDYIGIQFTYGDGGQIESTTSGTSWRIVTPLQMPTTNATFTASSSTTLSLYGTGATADPAAVDNAIMMGFNF